MSKRESVEGKKKLFFWTFLISLSWTRKLTERTRSLHSRLLQKQMLTPKTYWFFMLFLLAENWAEASTNDHLFNWDNYKKKTNISCVRHLFFPVEIGQMPHGFQKQQRTTFLLYSVFDSFNSCSWSMHMSVFTCNDSDESILKRQKWQQFYHLTLN